VVIYLMNLLLLSVLLVLAHRKLPLPRLSPIC